MHVRAANVFALTFIADLIVFVSQVTGNLVVAPENRVVAVGQSVQLNCSTDDKLSVNWLHYPVGSTSSRDVYISRTVVSPYHARFTVHREELGVNITAYNLLMTVVRVEDAGTYSCVDRTGMGEKRDAELTVLGSLPNCTTNIGSNGFICENDCHHLIEKIHCSCSIEYAGNVAPEMQWKTTSGQDMIRPQPIPNVSEKTVSSELNIVATKSMDEASVFWCSTQLPQLKWTSAPIKILCNADEHEYKNNVLIAPLVITILVAIGLVVALVVMCISNRKLRTKLNRLDGTSFSSGHGSSQSGSDEEKPCMTEKSNGICNSSAPSPA